MDLRTQFLCGVKIEAESDCTFFGTSNNSSCNLNSLNAFNSLSSPTSAFSSVSLTATASVDRPRGTEMDVRDHLADVFFPPDITDLDFDLLPDLPCDFSLLEEDNGMRDDSNSNSTSELSEIYLDQQSIVDSPPLTPPSPQIKLESETNNSPPSNNLLLSNATSAANLTKILPALKSSRGRSASHDSPDVQALKRHIRMIRNRESASLSRKKKKEYLTGLEQRIQELEIENMQLKRENEGLKTRLLHKHTSAGTPQNSASTSSLAKNKTRVLAKMALFGLCCFMFVSFRQPNMMRQTEIPGSSKISQLSKTLEGLSQRTNELPSLTSLNPSHVRSRRSVVWDLEENNNIDNSNSTGARFEKVRNGTLKRSKGFAENSHQQHSFRNATFTASASNMSKCPVHFNQTESLRVQNDLKGLFSRRTPKRKVPTKPIVYSLIDVNNNDNKGLTVYDEKMRRYSRVLDQLHRREDTFYVVSLAVENQLLLSAKSSNASSRPKMSFLMPWKNETLGGKEEVMQIDCEVTQVFNLNSRKPKRA